MEALADALHHGDAYVRPMTMDVQPERAQQVWALMDRTAEITSDAAAEMRRQAELRHEALFRAALALDQRASVIGAALAAVAAALAAGALSIALQAPRPLVVALAVMVLLFALAAAICFFAARPVRFEMPGLRASTWLTGGWLGDQRKQIDIAITAETERALDQAGPVQRRNGRALACGLALAALAPVAGLLTYLIVRV